MIGSMWQRDTRQREAALNFEAGLFESFEFDFSDDACCTFESLREDEYIRDSFKFRQRAFSRGILSNSSIDWLPHVAFFQSSTINKYAGDIVRNFMPVSSAMRSHIEDIFRSRTHKRLVGSDRYEVGIHQIRIIAEGGNIGSPTPEGPHQDGFDYIGIYCFQMKRVDGANTYLYLNRPYQNTVYSNKLNPGDAVIFDDRELFHYTGPIWATAEGRGARDICVITYKKI